ncbi:hypothetical protein M758_3G152500 [Ceratodon purpureus]|nr:hypothetical protein M758_3G152500 [Ceratodon purpureus]
MGREWIQTSFGKDSTCRLCTCELQFKMSIFLASSCGYNKAAEIFLRQLHMDVLGDKHSPGLPWLEPSEFAEVCIYRILLSSQDYTCGSMIQRGRSWKHLLVVIKLQRIHGDRGLGIVDTHCKFTVLVHKVQGINSWKT